MSVATGIARLLFAAGALVLILTGLASCSSPAQEAETEGTPRAAPVPSTAAPSLPVQDIETTQRENLETASFALG